MKCFLGISNFHEEISSLSHSIIFLYFFELITEEAFLIVYQFTKISCIDIITNYKLTWIIIFRKNKSKLWKSIEKKEKSNWFLKNWIFLAIERNIGITKSMEKLLLPVIVGTGHTLWKLMTWNLGKIIFRYQTLNRTILTFQREKDWMPWIILIVSSRHFAAWGVAREGIMRGEYHCVTN